MPDVQTRCRADTVAVAADSADLAQRAAALVFREACRWAEGYGQFVWALSGGSTPRPMLRRLAQEPYLSGFPWEQTHLFWVDERWVPATDPDSNYGAAKQDLIDRVPLPPENVHFIPTDTSPPAAASWYEGKLIWFFQKTLLPDPFFDFVLLGVGSDGHTASLFPGAIPASADYRWAMAVKGGVPDLDRITLSPWVLNRSRHICFLVSGRSKAETVVTLLQNPDAQMPAALIEPVSGNRTWLLDPDAAALLDLQEEAK